jgi:hypothetical protein
MPCAGGWVVRIFSSEEKRERGKKDRSKCDLHPARLSSFSSFFHLILWHQAVVRPEPNGRF